MAVHEGLCFWGLGQKGIGREVPTHKPVGRARGLALESQSVWFGVEPRPWDVRDCSHAWYGRMSAGAHRFVWLQKPLEQDGMDMR